MWILVVRVVLIICSEFCYDVCGSFEWIIVFFDLVVEI